MAGRDLYDCLLIYNHDDSSFSDGGRTSSLLFRYVNFVDRKLNSCEYSIHHLDRDSTPGSSVFNELERVIESSQVILLILDKGFLRNSWKCYSRDAAIKNLIDTSTDPKSTTSNRLIPVLIHLEKNEIPFALKTLTAIEIMEESDIDKNWKKLKKAIDSHLGPERIPRSTVARNPQYPQLTPEPQYAPAVSKEPRVNPKSNGPSSSLLPTDVETDAPQSMTLTTAATVQQSVAIPQNHSFTSSLSQSTSDSGIGLMSPEVGSLNVASFLQDYEAPDSLYPSNQIAHSVTLQDEPDSAVNQSPEGPNSEDGERPSFFFRAVHILLHAIFQPDKVYAPP